MKKFIFGIMVTVIGSLFTAFFLIYSILHLWNYNGTDGLLICWYEGYIRK